MEERVLLSIAGGAGDDPAFEAPKFVPGEIIVGFEGEVGDVFGDQGAVAALELADHQVKALGLHTPDVLFELPGAEHRSARLATRWQLPGNADVLATAARLAALPGIAYAEPNYVVSTAALPNDPKFDELWGMHNTG